MKDVECPYCGEEQVINHDDGNGYEEDQPHEQECSDCGKSFVYYTSISYSYSAEKADCLNGGEHRYKERKLYGVGHALVRYKCEDCGHEKST